jgi:AcrR family transcriptional regulator
MEKDPTIDHKHDARHAHSEETRRSILLAAIRIIAEYGVAGASLRAINVAAGSRNSSAAHYHFGTKLAVVEEALALVYAEVSKGQEPLLKALEERAAQGRPVSSREVLEAGYLPYLALLSRPEFGPPAAKFVSRILVESDEEMQNVVNRLVTPSMHRSLALLKHALPSVPEDMLKLRIFMTVTNVIHGAGDIAALYNSPFGNLSGDNPLQILHALFEFIDAAVSAPPTLMTNADATRMSVTLFSP